MKFKKLNYNKKSYFLYGLIVGVLLLLPLVLSITFGKYQTRESIKLVEGNISYKPYDFKIMAMYQENDNGDYEEIETMPTGSYIINEEKSYCTLDNVNINTNVILKTENGNHIVSNLNKNEKCYIWFNKVSTIQNIIETHNLAIRSDFSTTLTADTTGTLFMAPDDYGTSYYFAGAPTDNWVKFAGFYWRIIRINGDGTLRMIYSGTEESGPVTTGEGTQIGTSAFNTSYDNNAYVGYQYTLGEVHGTGTDSTIKGLLDAWYGNNLKDYSQYIATGNSAIFCNDRQPSISDSGLNGSGGTGTTTTYYYGYMRLVNSKTPTLKCTDSGDRFSTSIGLITADEVAYAGGVYGTANQNYYLYMGHYYWTMSPCFFISNYSRAYVFLVLSNGILDWNGVGVDWTVPSVRPVINLKADTQFSSGDGTSTNPYVVS